jgi:hypothetical protein
MSPWLAAWPTDVPQTLPMRPPTSVTHRMTRASAPDAPIHQSADLPFDRTHLKPADSDCCRSAEGSRSSSRLATSSLWPAIELVQDAAFRPEAPEFVDCREISGELVAQKLERKFSHRRSRNLHRKLVVLVVPDLLDDRPHIVGIHADRPVAPYVELHRSVFGALLFGELNRRHLLQDTPSRKKQSADNSKRLRRGLATADRHARRLLISNQA